MNAEIPAAVELQRVLPTRGTGLEVLAKGGSLLRAHFQNTQNIFKSSDTEGELGDSCLRYLRRQLVLPKGKFVTNATLSQPGISQLRTLQEQKKTGRLPVRESARSVSWRAAGQSLPKNPNRYTHNRENESAPSYRRFS